MTAATMYSIHSLLSENHPCTLFMASTPTGPIQPNTLSYLGADVPSLDPPTDRPGCVGQAPTSVCQISYQIRQRRWSRTKAKLPGCQIPCTLSVVGRSHTNSQPIADRTNIQKAFCCHAPSLRRNPSSAIGPMMNGAVRSQPSQSFMFSPKVTMTYGIGLDRFDPFLGFVHLRQRFAH